MIRLRVLGSTELLDTDGRELSTVLAQPKRLALLSYLAVVRGFHRRDTLLALFWPDLDTARSREALNQAIRFLRKELGGSPGSVILSRGTGELGIESGALWCDGAAFRDHFEAKRYGEALDLYRGDLLPGFFADDSGGFEEWVEGERARLRAAAARAAREVAEAREREQSYTTAVISARRAVELAGLDERVVRDLLALLDRLGDRAGAIHAYEEFAQRLANELEAEPAAETKAIVEQIRRREVARAEAIAERPPAVVAPHKSKEELQEIVEFLRDPQKFPNLGGRLPKGAPVVGPPATDRTSSPAPDAVIGGWVIVRELGQGGMATVYMARDIKHDRYVALKLVRPELMTAVGTQRFLREIQITAQLAHPHIVPLIDSGSHEGLPYLVTPYVAGESLRARLDRETRLPFDDALRLAGEIAEALDYAHRCGIIHRDIKPENILLADGHAIVADFGIARALAASDIPRGEVTAAGVVIGSPSYMSPEALRGGPVGAQSDVYALGCMLIEMLSGTLPSRDETSSSLLKRPGFESREIARLAADCIAPAAERRPQTAALLSRRLEAISRDSSNVRRTAWRRTLGVAAAVIVVVAGYLGGSQLLAARRVASVDSNPPRDLAVLYFDDLTPDKHLAHVAAGLTEELIDRLSQVEGLHVISPNGVRVFRDSNVALDTVARRLNVATIVTGSVSGAGPLIKLAVRLIDGRTGTQLRSHVQQRPMWDLFSLQDSVSNDVSFWLRDHLGRQVRLRELQRGTTSLEAWQTVQRAEELIRETFDHDAREPALLATSDSLLIKAEALDPRWVDPMARRARVAFGRAGYQPARLTEVIALCDSVLRRSEKNAEALAVRGEARLALFRFGPPAIAVSTLRAAEADLHRAVSARPDLAEPWAVLGDVLLAENRYAEAIEAYHTALNTDAFLRKNREALNGLFFAALGSSRFDEAEQTCSTTRARFSVDPRFQMCRLILLGHRGSGPADVTRAWAEAQRIDMLDSAGMFRSTWSFRQMMVAAVLVRSGHADSARAVVRRTGEQLNGRAPAHAAEAYVHGLLGDRDSAIRVLDQYVKLNPRGRIGLARNPWYRAFADDPRFRALAEE